MVSSRMASWGMVGFEDFSAEVLSGSVHGVVEMKSAYKS